eukprot:TRINITY_DN4573_c0_g1_i1.p2 TRINITY_DN4573_c0_g1~~TRINITY_DN4573_c0_g1_i1.p2  ORF type:complete len:106 (-),score=12.92 TRINITY_DN4573_c0_g1_i1:1985-2302(-)
MFCFLSLVLGTHGWRGVGTLRISWESSSSNANGEWIKDSNYGNVGIQDIVDISGFPRTMPTKCYGVIFEFYVSTETVFKNMFYVTPLSGMSFLIVSFSFLGFPFP